jgi:predicted GNAT family N-acyltransferase
MKGPVDIAVRPASWHTDRNILSAIREQVFIKEQSVPAELEHDGLDASAWHVIALAESVPVGTGRLLADGHIGRMAVLRDWRGIGAGAAMLGTLLRIARSLGMQRVVLNAQLHALPFYLHQGFQPVGEDFMEAGIPHRRMERDL